MSNVRNSCKLFVMMDNCIAFRGRTKEIADGPQGDGDAMMYQYSPKMMCKTNTFYDLRELDSDIIDLHDYTAVSHCGVEGYEKTIAFVALIRGKL